MSKDYDPSPWFPETNPVALAVLGKALEEVFELLPLIDQFVPPRGHALPPDYWQHLAEELADVQATLILVIRHYGLEHRQDIEYSAIQAKNRDILCDLGKAISRVLIQGIDEFEPRTGVSNRLTLERHVSLAQAMLSVLAAPHDLTFIVERIERKVAYLTKWHTNMQAALDQAEHDRKMDA